MNAETGTGNGGIIRRYYKCSGKKQQSGCTKSQIQKDIIENFIISKTLEILQTEGIINKLADKVFENTNSIKQDNSIKNYLIKEKKKIQFKIDNFLEAIGNGISTISTKLKLEELEKQLIEIDTKILSEDNKTKIILTKEEIKKFIISSLKKEPSQMINLLIKKIILYEDKVEIYYNYTNRKSPDTNSQDFLFIEKQYYILKQVEYYKNEMVPILLRVFF